ncbi:MAG: diguanylate cyclase [Desulfuromonas sp.]|nr:MAG: diguanylate cyclase [Desulfuromonas sp.]
MPNRFLLQDRLSQCIARAHRNRDRVAILYLDFDRFKNINDSLGHSVGDEVLQAVAERLQTCIREGDTVARIGGDEFVLLLPDLKEGECVVQVAKKILDLGNKPYAIGNYQLRVTVSVGISVYPDDGTDVDSLLKNADAAMYHAKAAGRDSYYYYTQDMNARALDILQMENSLQSALDNQEFHLCYQPQVDLASGRIVGAEALLRWNHPEKGEIPPGRFIPVAEDRGLISPIGAWVIETACRQNRQWQQEGLRPVQVAVNISAQQLHHAEFSSHLQAVLEETGLSPSLLELELTESAVMQDAEQMIDLLNALKKLGLSLAIDDFGTGYSSLSYLKRFPIDRLKIDQSFIKDLTLRHEEEAITQAIIGMGRTLKMKAIAEGVETDEQLRFLKQAGCDEIQGFLFSKQLPAEEFAQLLAADRRLDGGLPASG